MYSIVLTELSSKSDLRAIVGAISNVLGVDKKGAVELAKNLPLTLAKDLPEKEATLMASMFINLGAGIKVTPPLEEFEKPIRDFKTEPPKRGIPLGCVLIIMLGMAAFAYLVSSKYEWIADMFRPHPGSAETLLQKGNMKKAKQSIKKQLGQDPNNVELWVLMGKYYIGAARKRMEAEKWKSYGEAGALPELDSAIMLFRRAESLNPKDGSILKWISATELMRRALPEAEAAARRAVSISPSEPDNWNQLGSVLVEMGDMGQAEQAFYSALKIDERNASALKNLSILNLYYTKDAEKASKFMFAFLRQKESEMDVDAFQMRTDLASAMVGDFNPSWKALSPPPLPIAEFEKRFAAVSKHPNLNKDYLLQEQLGLLYMSKGENNAAENYFIKAIQLSHNNESSRKMLAVIYLKDANYDKALGVMQAAADNNAKDPFFWKNLGVLLKYYRANPAEARKAFSRYFALGADPYEKRVRREM